MCRLLYLPKNVRPPEPKLRKWLKKLELSFGGDGCGVALDNGETVKGVRYTVRDSSQYLTANSQAAVWHTRKVSCGSETDELCHPFETVGGSYLVHNGHWAQGAYTARMLSGDWSDTRVAALHIRLYGWESFARDCYSGVWLHLTPKGIQVHYPTGELVIDHVTGTLASEPCPGWGIWDSVQYGTYDVNEYIPIRAPETLKDTYDNQQFGFGSGDKTWRPVNPKKSKRRSKKERKAAVAALADAMEANSIEQEQVSDEWVNVQLQGIGY